MTILNTLEVLRARGGEARTAGLPDDVILRFAAQDIMLGEAVEAAAETFQELPRLGVQRVGVVRQRAGLSRRCSARPRGSWT